jgi:hypothetical protein
MEVVESAHSKNSETVSEVKPKKTRKFTWTDKRKAQFEKMLSANREKSKSKKRDDKHEKKDSGKEKEITQEEIEDSENQKGIEKEEKQSKNIVKRIMDPHFLSRKDRHNAGTISDLSSESEEQGSSESESESSSDSESSVEVKKKPVKKPKIEKKDWKVQRQLQKMKAKNKLLQNLFLTKSKIKYKKYSPENQLSEDSSDPEPSSSYSRPPTSANPPIYFC